MKQCTAQPLEQRGGQEDVMVIESRTIVGGAAALAIVGIGLWVSTSMMGPPAQPRHMSKCSRSKEKLWTVEVKELGSVGQQKTAAAISR